MAETAAPLSTIGKTMGLAPSWLSNHLGGASPLLSMGLGAGLGIGGGYLAGSAIDKLMPARQQPPGTARRIGKRLGAALGVVPGLWLWSIAARQPDGSALKSLVSPNPLFGRVEKSAFSDPVPLDPIPVDAFNRIVLSDPFTSPADRLAAATLAESAAGNSPWLTPSHLARAAVGAGLGYGQAYIAGKVLGAAVGLPPEYQKMMSRFGLIAGAVKALTPW